MLSTLFKGNCSKLFDDLILHVHSFLLVFLGLLRILRYTFALFRNQNYYSHIHFHDNTNIMIKAASPYLHIHLGQISTSVHITQLTSLGRILKCLGHIFGNVSVNARNVHSTNVKAGHPAIQVTSSFEKIKGLLVVFRELQK